MLNSVVKVEFNQTSYSVDEDAGFACITLVSDIPAPANFCVNVSFTDGTATGECKCVPLGRIHREWIHQSCVSFLKAI